ARVLARNKMDEEFIVNVIAFDEAPCAALLALAAQLRAQHRLKLPDALQLATALEAGASAFVTHDRDFSGVSALPVLTGS
ncbi:MAG: PIN domain-containing protein, partial [Hydrogenophaga sp.]|nr:PIN domain-containing protein [Hydrogenophaga sp.]